MGGDGFGAIVLPLVGVDVRSVISEYWLEDDFSAFVCGPYGF